VLLHDNFRCSIVLKCLTFFIRTGGPASAPQFRQRTKNNRRHVTQAELTQHHRRGQPPFQHHRFPGRTRNLHSRRLHPDQHLLHSAGPEHPARPGASSADPRGRAPAGFESSPSQFSSATHPADLADAETVSAAAAPLPLAPQTDAWTDDFDRFFNPKKSGYEKTPACRTWTTRAS